MTRAAVLIALALATGLPAGPAAAQADYPSRLVTIVAPSAPGGLYSLFARIIANRLERRLGAPSWSRTGRARLRWWARPRSLARRRTVTR